MKTVIDYLYWFDEIRSRSGVYKVYEGSVPEAIPERGSVIDIDENQFEEPFIGRFLVTEVAGPYTAFGANHYLLIIAAPK